jgi:hypothetical protein
MWHGTKSRTPPGLVTVSNGPDNGAMLLKAAAAALLLTLSAAPARTPAPAPAAAPGGIASSRRGDGAEARGWRTLEPGLELGLFDGPPAGEEARPIAVVRIDPARFELKLRNA